MSIQQDVMIHIITDSYEVCACNLDIKDVPSWQMKITMIFSEGFCLQLHSRTNLRAKSPNETESLAPGQSRQIVVAGA